MGEVCRSSSRLLLARPSPSMLKELTPSSQSKPRSRTKKVSLQINSASSSPESSSKTAELLQTTTSKRSQPSISYSASVVVCKSSSRPSLARPSLLTLKELTPLSLSRLRSKTRKEFPQINSASSSPESNSKTDVLSLTTTSKRNQPSISYSVYVVVCKSSSRPSLARPSLLTLKAQTPSSLSR